MVRFYDCLKLIPPESVREASRLPLRGYDVESPSHEVLRTWVAADGSILFWATKPRGYDGPWKLLERVDGRR